LYTLSTWALWLVLAALIGGVVGWLLRSLGRGGRGAGADAVPGAAAADAVAGGVDPAELAAARDDAARARARAAELQDTVAQLELAIVQNQTPLPPGSVVSFDQPPAVPAAPPTFEMMELNRKVAEQQHWISELRVRLWNSEAKNRDLQAVVDSHVVAAAPPTPDLAAATHVLGVPVRMNDFTVIEGIGPAIANLCVNRGITTWWSMANTDLSVLRSMLAEAGPKFQVHDPTSWPQQARLLANGEWEKFRRLVDALRVGYDTE
jgi:predicted flap endonuclease-1-like 5' DNA nuclease